MKKLIYFLIIGTPLYGQTGINTTSPKATLDIMGKGATSESEGVIPPRLTKQQLAAKTTGTYALPQIGTIVYVSDATTPIGTTPSLPQVIEITAIGYYYFDGVVWKKMGNTADTSIYTNDGTLTGNRIVTQGANTLAFTGTAINAFSVDGNTFSVDAANHRVGIGTAAPNNYLHIAEPGQTSGIITSFVKGQTITATGGASGFSGPGTYFENLSNPAGNKLFKMNFTSNGTEGILNFQNVSDDGGTSGGNIMAITKSGRVGIGTTTPQRSLEVSAGNNPIRVTNLQALTGAGGSTNILAIDASGDVRRVPFNNLLAGPVSLNLVTTNYSATGNESVIWNGGGAINVTLPIPTDDQVGKSLNLVASGGVVTLAGSMPTVTNAVQLTSIPTGKRITIFAIAKNVWGNATNEWVVTAKDF
nr:hypothetical protein [uncultured Chryseobacterium sp.]